MFLFYIPAMADFYHFAVGLLFLLCLSGHASAATSLPMSMHLDTSKLRHIVALDRSRVANLKHAATLSMAPGLAINGSLLSSRIEEVAVVNHAFIYTVDVGVGSPPTFYSLIVDTGSSNTWVGASKPYVMTSTSQNTGNRVVRRVSASLLTLDPHLLKDVSYGSGAFHGIQYIDTVALAPKLVISDQGIGAASSTDGFDDFDGIFGIGPVQLTAGTVEDEQLVPTVTDNLFEQGLIEAPIVGIAFAPIGGILSDHGDSISFGGPDSLQHQGPIYYAPITSTAPSSDFVGVDVAITYDQTTPILSFDSPGIIDTGTSLILLASDAFERYRAATGAHLDEGETGLLALTLAQFAELRDLQITFAGHNFTLNPRAQRIPLSLNVAIGGSLDLVYLAFGKMDTEAGQGMDFVLGLFFLQRFYHVYDSGDRRVGLAETIHTFGPAIGLEVSL